jgi:hypothetical protein
MATMTIGIEDRTTTQKRKEHFAHTESGVTAPEQSTKRALIEKHRHEEWKHRIEEDWQNHVETLQQYLRELLVKNQQLRIALTAANESEGGYGDARNL